MIVEWIGNLLLIAGGILLVLAAWGVLILPDALARQHAATKAGTLAISLICVGAMVLADSSWFSRLLAILVFLFITLPLASHLLARAVVRHGQLEVQVQQAPLVGGEPPSHK